ncbi:hypothetical protein CHARACLAT_024059 [Characodon lateralis]|uniref:Uncharacterized protein n=1 Tax=Characodon lateralis TaxID=208331 RepID=A0ABU7D9W7_9TELE|nr:hypothetical protein [Characodon lateralis]
MTVVSQIITDCANLRWTSSNSIQIQFKNTLLIPRSTWTVCFSTLPPDLETLVYRGNAKLHLRRGLWTTEQRFVCLLSTGKTLLRSLVQEGLNTSKVTAVIKFQAVVRPFGFNDAFEPLFFQVVMGMTT